MELKAKPIPRWAASFLDCLKNTCTNPEESGKKEGRERERRGR